VVGSLISQRVKQEGPMKMQQLQQHTRPPNKTIQQNFIISNLKGSAFTV